MKSQEEQQIQAKAEQARERLRELSAELGAVDDEIEALAPRRAHHQLLEQACTSLEQLGELGVATLFWGDRMDAARVEEQLQGVRSRVDAFQKQLGELDRRREGVLERVDREEKLLEILGEDLYDLREAEERRKLEWVVEREISPVPRHVQLLAWARGGEDDKRFYRTLAASLLASLLLGLTLPMIHLPLPKRFVPEEMPRRLAQLVRQVKAKPVPPPKAAPETAQEELKPEKQEPKPEEPAPKEKAPPDEPAIAASVPDPPQSDLGGQPAPETAEVAEMAAPAQKKVEKAGILAFKDEFASLSKDKVAKRLGADARYGQADDVSRTQAPSRSMLTTNAPGASGGINVASLSRNVGGGGGGGDGDGNGQGGGGGIRGVPVGRATSSIAGIGPGGRPTARGGPGLSRTDEEIQIVFDRYKARFYRLYNRELRNDPTLQGQMILKLTIEPDGSVSMCSLQSSDMDAPELASQIVEVVRTIDFGAKDGVQALTIVYPIDFLPASN